MTEEFEGLDVIDRMLSGEKHWSVSFWTEPLTFEKFVGSAEHMKNVRLAPKQIEAVNAFLGTNPMMMFDKENERPNLAVLAWGKGSGKNMVGTLVQAYLFYVLLCLRNPLNYFGFPDGESIDMINVAASAAQAKRNFFDKFTRRVKNWKWLTQNFAITQHGRPVSSPEKSKGTIKITEDSVEFDGGIKCISAHSDSKGYEGYSVIFFVMDEASSWETEYVETEGGDQVAMSRAHTIFDTLRTSAISRSWKWGGLIISYPRLEDDFTLTMAQDILDGKKSGYADIAATWEVKPMSLWVNKQTFEHKVERPWGTKLIYPPMDFFEEFRDYPQQSELKYACIPARTKAYFIYNNIKIHECAKELEPIVKLNKLEIHGGMPGTTKRTAYWGYEVVDIKEPNPKWDYYCHIDLSVSSDTAVLGIAHGEPHMAEVVVAGEDGDMSRTRLTQKVVIDQLIEWVPDNLHLVSSLNVDEVLEKIDAKLRFRYIQWDQWQCLAAGTMVTSSRGLLPIEQIQIGDMVQSRSGAKPVVNTFSFGKRDTLKISTSSGNTLEGTPHHRIEVLTRKVPNNRAYAAGEPAPWLCEWEWKRLDEIVVGDTVRMADTASDLDSEDVSFHGTKADFGAMPKGKLQSWELPTKMTPDFAEWLGLIWGDGNIDNAGVYLTLTEDEYPDAANLYERVFGFKPAYVPYGTIKHTGRKCGKMTIASKWLVKWMRAHGLNKPLMPEAVLRSSKAVRAAFIKGLIATDGTISNTIGQVVLFSKHRELLDQVQVSLMSDFGVTSHLTIRYRTAGASYKEGFQYQLSIHGSRQVIYDLVCPTYSRKRMILEEHLDRPGRRVFTKVTAVEPSCTEVYDLEVADDPSYRANGFISHNSNFTLEKAARSGKKAGQHNVNNKDYFLLRALVHSNAIDFPKNDMLITELEKLIWNGKRVDHTAFAGKDRADTLAGLAQAVISGHGEKRLRISFSFA